MTKVALVTGAGSGIGRAVAIGLASTGWDLALMGRRRDALDETASACVGDPLVCAGDVGVSGDVGTAFAAIEARWGRLDLLFNNAGTGAPGPIDALSDEAWDRVVRTNLTGSFHCARAAFALMKRQQPRGGRIVNNGSCSAQVPRPWSVAYTATKHAITGLTKSLSLDGRGFDIACGQIDVGNADTAMAAPIKAGVPQADGSMRAEPVMAVADVVDAVLYMAGLPLSANVLSMTVMANAMPLVGRG